MPAPYRARLLSSPSNHKPRNHQEYPPWGSNVLALLTVVVLTGQVEVQQADQQVKVSAGESRAFATQKKPMFGGRVVSVALEK